jgi:hypothetical protein
MERGHLGDVHIDGRIILIYLRKIGPKDVQ